MVFKGIKRMITQERAERKKEKALVKRAKTQLRREALKARLESQREYTVRVARERERLRAQRKIEALKRGTTRGYSPIISFGRPRTPFTKPKKKGRKKKKKRKKKK